MPKISLSRKNIAIIACAVILLGVIIGIITFFSSDNPQTILARYARASFNGDFQTASRYSAFDIDNLVREMHTSVGLSESEFNDQMYDVLGVRGIEELFRDMAEEEVSQLEREFGSDFRVFIEIIDYFTLTRREIADKISALERLFDRMGIDGSNIIRLDGITEMVEYQIEVTIRGRRSEDVESLSIIMVRIGRNWRVLDDLVEELAPLARFLG